MNVLSDDRRVLTYGTFDLFEVGHARLLKRLAGMGDRLIVGLSTDRFAAENNQHCTVSFEDRAEVLMATRYVDHIIPEDDWEQKRSDIVNYNIGLFVMSDRWAGQFDHLSDITHVLYLPRTAISRKNAIHLAQPSARQMAV